LGRQVLDLFDELASIQTRHGQIGEHQVDSALLKTLQRFLAATAGDYVIAAGFQHDFADGERLFVIVDAEDRSFWFHFVSETANRRDRAPGKIRKSLAREFRAR